MNLLKNKQFNQVPRKGRKYFYLNAGLFITGLIISLVGFVMYGFAAPPGSPYRPGETLEPACAPGDANCTVVAPAISGENDDITALLSLESLTLANAAATDSFAAEIEASAITSGAAMRLISPASTSFISLYDGTGDVRFYTVDSDPDGLLTAPKGSIAFDYATPAAYINQDGATDWEELGAGGGAETDPVFGASAAAGIVAGDITDWDTAFSWGDHAAEGYLTSELDPFFDASPASTITGVQIGQWDTAYGWGDHALAGYISTTGANADETLRWTGSAWATTAFNVTSTNSLRVNLIPAANNGYALGSTNYRWQDLYLASNSLHLGMASEEFTVSYYNGADGTNLNGFDQDALRFVNGGGSGTEITMLGDGGLIVGNTTRGNPFVNFGIDIHYHELFGVNKSYSGNLQQDIFGTPVAALAGATSYVDDAGLTTDFFSFYGSYSKALHNNAGFGSDDPFGAGYGDMAGAVGQAMVDGDYADLDYARGVHGEVTAAPMANTSGYINTIQGVYGAVVFENGPMGGAVSLIASKAYGVSSYVEFTSDAGESIVVDEVAGFQTNSMFQQSTTTIGAYYGLKIDDVVTLGSDPDISSATGVYIGDMEANGVGNSTGLYIGGGNDVAILVDDGSVIFNLNQATTSVFTVIGNDDPSLFFVDPGSDRVAVGMGTGLDAKFTVVENDDEDTPVLHLINNAFVSSLETKMFLYDEDPNNDLTASRSSLVFVDDGASGSLWVKVNNVDDTGWERVVTTSEIGAMMPDGTVDNSTLRWDDATSLWAENFNFLVDTSGNATVSANLVVNGDTILGNASGDTLMVNALNVSVPNNLNFDSNTLFINSSTDRVGIGTNNPNVFKLQVAGNVGPNANNSYDLGSDAYRWKDLYLASSSLHIGNTTADEFVVSYDNVNNNLEFNANGAGDAELTIRSGGNVGIGTETPEFKLDLNSDGGIISRGTYGAGATLTTAGAGTRFIWYPRKAALRAGLVTGTQWDDANIGIQSIALGTNAIALGGNSAVIGGDSNAAGADYSIVAGGYNNVAGDYSSGVFAGYENIATGWYSVVVGGDNNSVWDDYSAVLGGGFNYVYASHSNALGFYNEISGIFSNVIGRQMKLSAAADRTTVIGYAEADTAITQSDAVILYSDQAAFKVGIGDVSPVALLDVGGGAATSIDGIDDLLVADDLEIDGTIFAGDLTTGSVVFAGTGGQLSQDNAAFFWKAASDSLGIGTNSPEMKLDLSSDGGIIARGTYGSGVTLTTAGAGTRMIWYPRKGAFRAGTVNGTQWNDANIGDYSFAGNFGNWATGNNSTAFGYANTASGIAAGAFGGYDNRATATYAVVIGGTGNLATGMGAFASGYDNQAGGDYSWVGGRNMQLTSAADNTFVWGYDVSPYSVTDANGFIVVNAHTVFNQAGGIYGFQVKSKDDDNLLYLPANSNNLGIGTSNPLQKFAVLENKSSSYAGYFWNDGDNADRYGVLVQAGQDSGSGTLIQFVDGDGTDVGEITFTGTSTIYGNSSDERLKENIKTTAFGITDLLAVKVRDFTWRTDGLPGTGFIAQELKDIYPYAVWAPDDPDKYWSVDYGKLTPLIIKGVQDEYYALQNLGLWDNRLILSTATVSDSVSLFVQSGDVQLSGLFYLDDDNNRVGIGRLAETHELEVEGDASKTVAGDWAGNSDERLKKNIVPLHGLETLMNLQPVEYEWKQVYEMGEDIPLNKKAAAAKGYLPSGKQYGFIAQQNLDADIPGFVEKGADGFYMMRYGTLDALFVSSIQELTARLQALENAPLTQNVINNIVNNIQGNITGNINADSLVVLGDAEFQGNIIVKKQATFGGDSLGRVKILPGHDVVDVMFTENYAYAPIVTLTLANSAPVDKYFVDEVTSVGFTVHIEPAASEETLLNWHAFGVEEGKIFVSDGSVEMIACPAQNCAWDYLELIIEESDEATEQPSDEAIEQPNDEATEQSSDEATEQPSDEATEQPSDEATEDLGETGEAVE